MNTYFLFLRAINVGGHNMIKMTHLTSWLQQLVFENIKTYLQSGNVVFQSKYKDVGLLENQIRAKIMVEAQLDIACIIRTHKELIKLNSLLDKYEADKPENSSVFVTMLSVLPTNENFEKLSSVKSEPDSFIAYGSDIVLVCQQPYHKTKLSNNLFERTLRVEATTRNHKTIQGMLVVARTIM